MKEVMSVWMQTQTNRLFSCASAQPLVR